jgi:hypothetical protein
MRNPRTSWLVLVAAALACGGGSADLSTSELSASAVEPGNAGGNKVLTAMSRNLYIGADITPFILGGEGGSPAEIWAKMQATNFPVRAGWLADEIVANRADVVGMQEVYRFQVDVVVSATGDPVGSQTIDYLDVLLANLAARGFPYRSVVTSSLLDVVVPIADTPQAGLTTYVTIADHDAIIVPEDAVAENASAHVFTYLAPLPQPILGVTEVPRGWVEADLKFKGTWLHFANTHLEIGGNAQLEQLEAAQAAELVANLPAEGPVVVTGDINADALQGKPAYQVLTSALADATSALGPSCCQAELLDNAASQLTERIDLVLHRGPITAEWAHQTGDQPIGVAGGVPPYWASDHAGVAAGLRLWDPRFYALR